MPGYDWRDSSGDVDASASGYNYSTGTSHGVSNNSSSISNNSSSNSQNQGNLYGGYSSAQEQAAAMYKAAGAVTSSALSGTALWKQDGLPEGVYHSTYQQGQQGYSPTGYIYIDPEGDGTPQALGRDKDGNIVWDPSAYEWDRYNQKWFRSNYTPWNPHATTHHGGGGGGGGGRGWGGWSGSWGGPGGYGTGIGGMYSRRWNPHMKNVNNFGSEYAQLFAQKEANKYKRPTNHWMFTQMLQSMPGGGITEAI